jgi:hypothetical protein
MAAASVDPKKIYKYKVKPGRWQLHLGNSNSNANSNSNSNPNSNPYTRKLRKSMTKMNKVLIPRIRINDKIIDADAGIYTWIIKGIDNSTLYATRIFTKQEIGTLHLDLDRQTSEMGDTRVIIGAGELKVSPGETPLIQFNLQSGTFTKDIIDFHLKKDISLIFPEDISHVCKVDPIWMLFFGTIDPEVQEDMYTLFDEIQQDTWKIAREMLMNTSEDELKKIRKFNAIKMVMKKIQMDKIKKDTLEMRPDHVVFSNDEIIELFQKRNPLTITPIKLNIRNRSIIYKRKRLTEFVTRMFCSFFGSTPCTNVQFLKSTKSDDNFINTGDAGDEFEVTAGKSLIVGATNSNRANNIERLSRYFSIRNNAPASGNNNVTHKRKKVLAIKSSNI